MFGHQHPLAPGLLPEFAVSFRPDRAEGHPPIFDQPLPRQPLRQKPLPGGSGAYWGKLASH